MRFVTAAALALLVLSAGVGRAAEPADSGAFLLSLQGLSIGANEFVDEFKLQTWGVNILAACQIPPGWDITAGRISGDGHIDGVSNTGVANLDRSRLSSLADLALITLNGPILGRAKGGHPETFNGYVAVGTYGAKPRGRKIRLSAKNVKLVPAERCPPPAARS